MYIHTFYVVHMLILCNTKQNHMKLSFFFIMILLTTTSSNHLYPPTISMCHHTHHTYVPPCTPPHIITCHHAPPHITMHHHASFYLTTHHHTHMLLEWFKLSRRARLEVGLQEGAGEEVEVGPLGILVTSKLLHHQSQHLLVQIWSFVTVSVVRTGLC